MAISDAIQHAQASELTISATCIGEQIKLQVRDNGVGSGSASANGLRTM